MHAKLSNAAPTKNARKESACVWMDTRITKENALVRVIVAVVKDSSKIRHVYLFSA